MEISIAVCEVDTKKHFHYNFNFKVLFLNLVFHALKLTRVLEWVACISACIGTFCISSIDVKFSPFSATDVLCQLPRHRLCWWCWHWPRLVLSLHDIVAAFFQFTVRKSSGARMPTGSTRRTTRSSRCWSSCWRPARTLSSSAWPRSTSENTSATIRAENSEFKKSSHLLWIAPRSFSKSWWLLLIVPYLITYFIAFAQRTLSLAWSQFGPSTVDSVALKWRCQGF